MNDLSIQGGRAYATAYASNEVKVQPASSTETAKSPTAAAGDTVSISSQARELFQQSSVNDAPAAPTTGGQSEATASTAGNSSDVSAPIVTSPGQITPMNGGGGVRPPESP